jgi:hypothetical protein
MDVTNTILLGGFFLWSCIAKDKKSQRRYIHHLPYEIIMTYLGIWDGYVEDYRDFHNKQYPPWWYHPYYIIGSALWMFWCAPSIIKKKLELTFSSSSPHRQVVTQHDSESIKITYEFQNKIYHIVKRTNTIGISELCSIHGIPKIGCVKGIDLTYQDVTEEVKPYLGPDEDWHTLELTAGRLGYKALKITKVDSETFDLIERTFEENDPLVAISDL